MSDTESIDITLSDSAEQDVRSDDERIEGGRYRGHELGDQTAEASVRTVSPLLQLPIPSFNRRGCYEEVEKGNGIR